jgi:integrase/recombinase XerD
MRYRPGALAVVGSNPTGPTESSVHILSKSKDTNKRQTDTPNTNYNGINNKNLKAVPTLSRGTNSYEMRDLYHRQNRLAYWIKRVNSDLDEPDRSDILKLVEHMQERERAILWIIRCVTAILLIRKQLGKPFRDTTKEDIKSILKWMDNKGYKASTNEKFRQVLKLFYKTVYGNNEYYPEQVKWFSVKLGKEKAGKETSMDMAEYLEEEEVKKLIEFAPTVQKRAFLACMYESGARPEEFLRLTNYDIRIDSNGAVLMLRGKTGERRVRIIAFAKLLEQWMEVHPLRSKQDFYPLWVSEATNFKNSALGIRGAQKVIEEALPRCGLTNKHARLYILRHSRATHLAKYLTEAQMCTFFGWVQGTQVVRRYIHLSGKDVDNALLALNEQGGHTKTEEYKLKKLKCKRCSEDISPGSNFCTRCALPANLNNEYTREMDLEKENKFLRIELESIRQEMESKFQQILAKIDTAELI